MAETRAMTQNRPRRRHAAALHRGRIHMGWVKPAVMSPSTSPIAYCAESRASSHQPVQSRAFSMSLSVNLKSHLSVLSAPWETRATNSYFARTIFARSPARPHACTLTSLQTSGPDQLVAQTIILEFWNWITGVGFPCHCSWCGCWLHRQA